MTRLSVYTCVYTCACVCLCEYMCACAHLLVYNRVPELVWHSQGIGGVGLICSAPALYPVGALEPA